MKTQIETVRTGRFSMDYFCFGRGSRILVVLPGLSVDSVMNYADSVSLSYRPLTDTFTVYVFDRRKELPPGYTVYDMAEDTAEAIRALGLREISLFGASQGGMMAMVIAIRHPALVSRLVLGSTAARMSPEQYRTVEEWIRLAQSGNARELYQAFGKAIYPADIYEQARELLDTAAQKITDADLHRFVILARALKDFDVISRLNRIACPVLVIGSRSDRLLGGEASRQIADRLVSPDCELHLYDGFGHAAYDTAPDYKVRMLKFLVA